MIKKNVKRDLSIIVLFMMLIGQMAVDIYMPSLPAMARYLGASNGTIQHLLTSYLIGMSLALIISGPLSDRFGRYRFILLGLTLYSIGALLTALLPYIGWMMPARFFQGIGAGITITTIRASVSDTYNLQRLSTIIANMTIVWGLGPILAPVIGGYLQTHLGWQANFYLMFIYGLILFILNVFFMGETLKPENRHSIHIKKIMANFKIILSNKSFIGSLVAMTMSYAIIIFVNVTAPFLLQNKLGLNPVSYGRTIVITGIAYLIGSILNKYLLRYAAPRTLALSGILLALISVVIMLALSLAGIFTVTAIVIPVAFAFLGVGLIYPNCLTHSMSLFPNIAGSALALIGALPLLGISIASAVAALLPETNATPLSITCCLLMVISLITYIRCR